MIHAEPLSIEKCANCGHDVMARDDLVKHTNIKDGHRYFTLHCQGCECDSPASPSDTKSELNLEIDTVKTREKVAALVRQGKTNKEISKILQLTGPTISYHVSAIKAVAGQETENAGVKRFTEKQTNVTKEITVETNNLPSPSATDLGILKSKIEMACFEGYYDTQKKLISETVKDEIYHAGKGKTITMEVRKLADRTRIVIEIIGKDSQ